MREEWDGEERRKEAPRSADLNGLEAAIHRLADRFEKHMEEEEEIKPHLVELIDILQKSKGAITFMKFLIYAGGLIGAFVLWVKDHVKL